MSRLASRPRRPALLVGLLGVLLAAALGWATETLTANQSEQLLRRRASEVTALLAADIDRVQSTIRSLRPIAEIDPSGEAFEASALPHLHGRVRSLAVLRPATSGFTVVAAVGDGLPDPEHVDGTRAALAARALTTPDVVSGVITDQWRRRVVIAQGPAPGDPPIVLWHESAVDPNLPHPLIDDDPFSDLHVALYAGSTGAPDELVLVSHPDWNESGRVVEVELPVGRDHWLVRVGAAESLVGFAAEHLPEVAFVSVLLAGILAGAVVQALGRRRDYALALVDERTQELRHALENVEQARRELQHRVLYDGLTGLPTRALLTERLKQALAHRRRTGEEFALVFCDLDRFKLVNDTLGHSAGDHLLQVMAQRIDHAARDEDTVARFGGDEFVVLVSSVSDADQALRIARRIAEEIRVPLQLHGQQLSVSASMGVALGHGGADAELMLRWADTAMYRAKERGRDRVQLFADDLWHRAEEAFHTEQALRTAIADGVLDVHFQPIVSLRARRPGGVAPGSSDLVGFEALVRWPKEDGTFWMPDRFIPLAEDTGLIVAMDRFVLRRACRFAADLNAERDEPITLSVNLSAHSLGQGDVVDVVREILAETGLEPRLLWIELTESGLVENLDDGRSRLMGLRQLGVRIAVDDFGTGWSSLTYLRNLPIDVIKIDRAFVAGVSRSHEDRAIVGSVVALAEALGLATVAEGVEDDLTAAVLRDLGCTRGQGYHWSAAVPAAAARDLVRDGLPSDPSSLHAPGSLRTG